MNGIITVNPLLDLSGLPRFHDIRPEHVEQALDQVLADSRARIAELEQQVEQADWDNFAQPLEDIDERLARLWAPVSHLNAVRDSAELRQAYEACLPKLAAYQAELGQNEILNHGYRSIADSPAFAALEPAQQKIVNNALRDFRLAGVALPAAQKQRFKEISQELAQLGNRFERNVLDATKAWHLDITDEADLAGVPVSVKEMAKHAAQRAGREGWRFGLDIPFYLPFMINAKSGELRRRMYDAYVTRASELGPNAGDFDNSPLMQRILSLRQEAARLLGFDNYAQVSLETKMADDPKQVLDFLRDLAARAKPVAERELEEVRTFARDENGASQVEPWDLPYYSEQLRRSRFEFSDEDIRPYFPAPRVLQGMFGIVQRLYGLRIQPLPDRETWDPSVEFFEIRDAAGEVRGRFFVDLYVRDHKRGGAWMADCISRKRAASGVQVPVAFLVCNFSPPVGDRPALLTHDEVVTMFHEFGHGLHHMLTKVDYVGVAGINGVAWDAVELPSQFMENWCWEREPLNIIGGHHETGEPLPDELLTKMKAAKNFQSAMQMLRQIEFALFDMLLHRDYDPAERQDIQPLLDAVREEVAVVRPPDYNRFQNSFSHIFAGGYAAGYYSYKWAEVLSADAFSRFEEEGIFNPDTGQAFLHHILEQGGTHEPMELFRAFRGREPSPQALLRHSGLAA
jgi:oligopeptidase A